MEEIEPKPNNCALDFICIDYFDCAHNIQEGKCKYQKNTYECKSLVAQVNACVVFLKKHGIEIK